jgi:LmbE family N-acetylglucosaminyl deacetylase
MWKARSVLFYAHLLRDGHYDHTAVGKASVELGRFAPIYWPMKIPLQRTSCLYLLVIFQV